MNHRTEQILQLLFEALDPSTHYEGDTSDDERKTRIGSLRKKAISASTKFRHSMTRKGRRSSRVMSIESLDDFLNVEELQAVDAFRQALILEDLLPARHDDYHMILRFVFPSILSFHHHELHYRELPKKR